MALVHFRFHDLIKDGDGALYHSYDIREDIGLMIGELGYQLGLYPRSSVYRSQLVLRVSHDTIRALF